VAWFERCNCQPCTQPKYQGEPPGRRIRHRVQVARTRRLGGHACRRRLGLCRWLQIATSSDEGAATSALSRGARKPDAALAYSRERPRARRRGCRPWHAQSQNPEIHIRLLSLILPRLAQSVPRKSEIATLAVDVNSRSYELALLGI